MATLVAPVRLLPTPAQADALEDTLIRANAMRNWVAAQGAERRCYSRNGLSRLTYKPARAEHGLTAEITTQGIGSVVACFTRDRRRTPTFGRYSAFPFSKRVYSFKADGTLSIWTINGRERIAFACGQRERERLAKGHGQAQLRRTRGGWMLDITVPVDPEPVDAVSGWLGVDLGIKNIASTQTERFAGGEVNGHRRRHRRIRGKLQARGTRAARRRLRQQSGREARFAKDINHRISKEIVRQAKRTGQGIALEDLTGIRDRIRARRPQRDALNSWAFAQLRQFITYKAELAGVPVLTVDPRNTSRECPRCGQIDKRNRPSQAVFCCVGCGHTGHADHIAAENISRRAAISQPHVPASRSTDEVASATR